MSDEFRYHATAPLDKGPPLLDMNRYGRYRTVFDKRTNTRYYVFETEAGRDLFALDYYYVKTG